MDRPSLIGEAYGAIPRGTHYHPGPLWILVQWMYMPLTEYDPYSSDGRFGQDTCLCTLHLIEMCVGIDKSFICWNILRVDECGHDLRDRSKVVTHWDDGYDS